MLVEADTESGGVYFDLLDGASVSVALTVHVADLVMVDLDDTGRPIGVEFAAEPTEGEWAALESRYPDLRAMLPAGMVNKTAFHSVGVEDASPAGS